MTKKGKRDFSKNAISNAYAAIKNARNKGASSAAAAFNGNEISSQGYQNANKDSKGRYRPGRRIRGEVGNGSVSRGEILFLNKNLLKQFNKQKKEKLKIETKITF